MCREEGSGWRRGGGDEPSSWRDSRREDFDREDRRERRDLRDRRDDRERENRAPQRDHDEGINIKNIEHIKNLNFLTDLIKIYTCLR